MGSRKRIIWINIVFFATTALFAVIGVPLYVQRFGISLSEILLFVFYSVVTGMSITAGYHRLFSHKAYKASPFVQFLFLFFGAAAFEQSALDWSSQHRDHHRYVDTDEDPYSIKKGFFYAHLGWMIFWEHDIHYENAPDLSRNKLVMHQHRYYYLWSIAAGILTPVLIGALTGHMLGAFLLSVCLRLTLVYHSTFCINSVCHMFGKATYDIHASARDHWVVALLTNGEGYHNFHHRFPADYRNGVLWYHWDPTKWLIALLSNMKLVWDLKKISRYRILGARLAAENLRVCESLKQIADPFKLHKIFERLIERYEKLKRSLFEWEAASNEYRCFFENKGDCCTRKLSTDALDKVNEAKKRFQAMYDQWIALIRRKPFELQQILLNSVS